MNSVYYRMKQQVESFRDIGPDETIDRITIRSKFTSYDLSMPWIILNEYYKEFAHDSDYLKTLNKKNTGRKILQSVK